MIAHVMQLPPLAINSLPPLALRVAFLRANSDNYRYFKKKSQENKPHAADMQADR